MPHLALSFSPLLFLSFNLALLSTFSLSRNSLCDFYNSLIDGPLPSLSFPLPFSLYTQPSPHSSLCITGGFSVAAVQFEASLHSLLSADAKRALSLSVSSSICFTVCARPPRTDEIISISAPLTPFNASPPNYCRHLIQPFANESPCARKYWL